MPRSMHLHTEIYPNLKRISSILASRDNWVSCNQTFGCLRLYGDSRVSRAQPRINVYEILLQHDWLLFSSRHNRFTETHSHLQLSYHITDRLLAAGNKWIVTCVCLIIFCFRSSCREYFTYLGTSTLPVNGLQSRLIIYKSDSRTLQLSSKRFAA